LPKVFRRASPRSISWARPFVVLEEQELVQRIVAPPAARELAQALQPWFRQAARSVGSLRNWSRQATRAA